MNKTQNEGVKDNVETDPDTKEYNGYNIGRKSDPDDDEYDTENYDMNSVKEFDKEWNIHGLNVKYYDISSPVQSLINVLMFSSSHGSHSFTLYKKIDDVNEICIPDLYLITPMISSLLYNVLPLIKISTLLQFLMQ